MAPGQARVGYGRVRDGCGRVRVRSASGRLGRQESCGARLGRAGSEVCRIRVRVKAQVNESVSGMSKAWLRACGEVRRLRGGISHAGRARPGFKGSRGRFLPRYPSLMAFMVAVSRPYGCCFVQCGLSKRVSLRASLMTRWSSGLQCGTRGPGGWGRLVCKQCCVRGDRPAGSQSAGQPESDLQF